MKLPEIRGSEGTTDFVRKIDRLFDYLYSRNPFAKNFKAPLRQETTSEWEPFLMSMINFLQSLKGPNMQPISSSRRQSVVNGFCIAIKSTIEIANTLLNTPFYNYVLTYRMSQDHLELLFSRIRRKSGWNNDPNTTNFTSSMRSLLLKNAISPSVSANCHYFEESEFIEFNVRCLRSRRDNVDDISSGVELQELSTLLNNSSDGLALWKKEILYYVGGFVVKSLISKIDCILCQVAMRFSGESSTPGSFLNRKNRSGLIIPSNGVYRVINVAENVFRSIFPHAESGKKLLKCHFIDLRIEVETLSILRPQLYTLFPTLKNHAGDSALEEADHVVKLVRQIVSSYVRVRLHHFARTFTKRTLFLNKPSQRTK